MASPSPGRVNRLSDFLAGIDDTFGALASSHAERADFLQAAQEFYLDYVGLPFGRVASLPFWRYLLHFSAVGVDAIAAGNSDDEEQQLQQREKAVAEQTSSLHPFLAVLISRSYLTANAPVAVARPPRPKLQKAKSTSEIGCQTDAVQEPVQEAAARPPTPDFTPTTPIVPPVPFSFASSSPFPSSGSEEPESFAFSRSASSSIAPSSERTLSSGTDYSQATADTSVSPPPTATDMRYSASAGGKAAIPGDVTPTPSPGSMKPIKPGLRRTQSLGPQLLIADRGDNAARLLPTAEGRLVLQVSIGGRKLLINPERPAEIQYHNEHGKVITQSLIANEDEAD